MPETAKTFERYAVYFAPQSTGLTARLNAFGTDWFTAAIAPDAVKRQADDIGIAAHKLQALLRKPAHYGLHATLKAPFRLAEHADYETLKQSVHAVAERYATARSPRLAVTDLDGFLALCPSGPSPEIDALAGACVTELDHLRAPLTAQERERRMTSPLDARAVELLDTWGYPHVLEHFRFHITLTDRLTTHGIGEEEKARLISWLTVATDNARTDPFVIEALTIFGDPGGGAPFQRLVDVPLASPASTGSPT